MYQPEIRKNAICSLYRIKRAYRKPMTTVLDELIRKGMKNINRSEICAVCRQEKNDENCGQCYISRSGRKGG